MNKRSVITTLLFLVCLTGLAQEDNDVLYIQPSKEVYETGEDLWFKAVKCDSTEKLSAKHRFDLFPEGGNLIDGVECVVAFKATYGNGMPKEIVGVVTEDGHEIATIKSVHDGMGQFTLTPHRGQRCMGL